MDNDFTTPQPAGAPMPPRPYGPMPVNPQPGFFEAIGMAFSRWTDIRSRSRRSEYWWFSLFIFLYMLVIVFMIAIFSGAIISMTNDIRTMVLFTICGVLLLALPVTIPHCTLTVRRLHDCGQSGYWVLADIIVGVVYLGVYSTILPDVIAIQSGNVAAIQSHSGALAFCGITGLVQLVLRIIIFIFTLIDSKPEPNKWGKSPKFNI